MSEYEVALKPKANDSFNRAIDLEDHSSSDSVKCRENLKSIPSANSIKGSTSKTFLIQMSSNVGEAVAMVNHIRNGIVQGNARIFQQKDYLYIELKDFTCGGRLAELGTSVISMNTGNSKIFQELYRQVEYKEIDPEQWAKILDWLFCQPGLFDGWAPKDKSRFTYYVKHTVIPEFDKRFKDFVYIGKSAEGNNESKKKKSKTKGSKKKKATFTKQSKKPFLVEMAQKNNQGRDLLRHIRNGFAHGHVKFIHKDKVLYLEIRDYSGKRQTSYMRFEPKFIERLYVGYNKLDPSKTKHS